MSNGFQYLDSLKDAIKELGKFTPDLNEAIEKGEKQAETRDKVIETINEMCDALQLASDLVSKELSTSIIEFSQVKQGQENLLRGYFERVAIRFSESSLWLLLHEGKVCGELHKVGDRFEQPFSMVAMSSLSLWENVRTFFCRSNNMSNLLHGLIEGEREYLRNLSAFLNEVRNCVEDAIQRIPWGNDQALKMKGEELIQLMRERRSSLQTKLSEIRVVADAVIAELH